MPVLPIALAVLIAIIAGTWILVLRGLNRGRGWQVERGAGESSLRNANPVAPDAGLTHVKDGNVARTWDPEL